VLQQQLVPQPRVARLPPQEAPVYDEVPVDCTAQEQELALAPEWNCQMRGRRVGEVLHHGRPGCEAKERLDFFVAHPNFHDCHSGRGFAAALIEAAQSPSRFSNGYLEGKVLEDETRTKVNNRRWS
jgi:hypothetical protein